MSSVTESEWSPLEQDRMVALAQYEAWLCPKCGGPLSECTDPKNEGKYKTEPPTRCHKTTAQLMATEDFDKRKYAEALLIVTQLVEDVQKR